ncbi:hypothetical protein GALMADRAFT_223393 [Galerina marginata CBS 339.88]|uniref:Heterokaryon incompatibility domain-containing protein n=1 Tax=Galerina marginata (strain CBS 339.88) TaxID=685588 RepID=A0A067TJJ1_GALM3|nr:hypothetical protein GALMADRAFT_223393 [Galerina marginata CBS 339.88]
MNNQGTQIAPLCDVCQSVDLLRINNREAATYQLGTWEDVKQRANGRQGCPFCVLMRSFCDRSYGWYETGKATINWKAKGGFFFGTEGDNLAFLNEDTATSPYGCARAVRSHIDPSLVKKWLNLCEVHHKESCTPKGGVIKTQESEDGVEVLHLIDTEDQCVIEAKPGVRYVALSYVWGPFIPSVRLQRKNVTELSTKGALLGLRKHFSKTINDAIDLVPLIGERYLWVDVLCLVQDDDQNMLDGISHMDMVYQCSILTIIAAHGEDANTGLPGLHPGSRDVNQEIIEVLPGIKMTSSTGVYNAMTERSPTANTHATRGWTLQELVLSHRALIFTQDRIYFRCRGNCWSEDTIYDNFPSALNDVLHSGTAISFLSDNETAPLPAFNSQIFRYADRHLTKESDTIHGLTGILRFLSVQVRSGLLEGLFTACFDISLLCWDNFPDAVAARRREGFPSWSWAGWKGIRDGYGGCCQSAEDANTWLQTMTYIVWFKRSPGAASPELVWDMESQLKYGEPEERHITYRSSLNDPYGRIVDGSLDNFRTRPDEEEDGRRAEIIREEMDKRNYHFLHFFAHTVLISDFEMPLEDWDVDEDEEADDRTADEEPGVETGDSEQNDIEPNQPADKRPGAKETRAVVKLIGASGVICGGVNLDDPKLMEGVTGPHELILLSKMDRWENFFNNNTDFVRPFYWVMLIGWQGPEQVVAERRGIGFLFRDCVEHVLHPGKVWKEIVLA